MIRNAAVVLLTSASFIAADPTAHVVGIGTRSFGMANNFTALANDFSAIFWNPAGMAFIPVREVHFAMDVNRQENTTDLGGTSTTAWQRRYRVSSGGLLRSLPTTQGGFAFALGFSSPYLLDDRYYARGNDRYMGESPLIGYSDTLHKGGVLLRESYDYDARGQCSLWSAGLGWQIAPGLGFGFAAGLFSGSESRELRVRSFIAGYKLFEDFESCKEREYLGYDARIGLMYHPAGSLKGLSLGCRLELPRIAVVAQNYTEVDAVFGSWTTTAFGTLKSGFSGAVGAALQTSFTTVSADATFRAPLPGAPEQSESSRWKEGIGAGIEVPIRPVASVLRGGYSYALFDLSPMRIDWGENGPGETPERYTARRDRHLLTAGYSLLAGNGVSLDIVYGYMVWAFLSSTPDWPDAIAEKHELQRGAMSISIRY